MKICEICGLDFSIPVAFEALRCRNGATYYTSKMCTRYHQLSVRQVAVAPLGPVHVLSPGRQSAIRRWVVSGTNKFDRGLSRRLQWLNTSRVQTRRHDIRLYARSKLRSWMAFCQPAFGIASLRHLRSISRRLRPQERIQRGSDGSIASSPAPRRSNAMVLSVHLTS